MLPWSTALAVPFTMYAVVVVLRTDAFAVDFHNAFWPAAHRVVHGLSPYVDPHSPIVAGGAAFVYPAPAALLIAPLGLLPRDIGDVVFTGLSMVAVVLTLRALRVCSWPTYGAAFLWAPVFSGWQTANVTLLLGLGIAAAWRYRARVLVAGALIGLLVSVKLFLWPLGVWLLATRRYRTLGYAVATGLVLNVIGWSILGWHELSRYEQLTKALTTAEERRSYGVISLALEHGAQRPLAYGLGLALAAVSAVFSWREGRSGRDAACLSLCIAVSLLATPLVWLHYFALLLIPVALARPPLSPVWGLPLLMWVAPATGPATWQLVVTMSVAAAVIGMAVLALRARPSPSLV